MISSLFKLNGRDLIKGFVLAILIFLLQYVLNILQTKGLSITWIDLKVALDIAVKGGAAYLLKNLLSDETGKVFGKI